MRIPSLEKLSQRTGRNYWIRVLIGDNNSKWLDISDSSSPIKDRIISYPRIKINTDSKSFSHRFLASSGDLVVDNTDRFWDGRNTYTLTTIEGTTASFSNTKNQSETVWVGHKVQFRLVEEYHDMIREKAIGTFLIDDIETSLQDSATLRLVDLSQPLRKRDASTVRNGQSPYQNRSVSFLVKKLTELEYGDSTNGLLSTSFDIDPRINLSTYDGSSTLSVIGPPPMETDTNADGISNTFYERGLKTRAICMAPSTISLANAADSKNTLYLGCDEQIYSYNPSTDLFIELTAVSAVGTGLFIRNLWYDDAAGVIYGTASENVNTANAYKSTIDWWDWVSIVSGFKIFKYTTVGGLVVLSSPALVYDGKFIYRDGANCTLGDGEKVAFAGQHLLHPVGSNLFTPYRQMIRSHESGSDYQAAEIVEYADTNTGDPANADCISTEYDYIHGFFPVFLKSDNPTNELAPLGLRYSIGQQGNVCFNKDSKIITYSAINPLDHDTDI